MASIFTHIIEGKIPSLKLYEDEWTYSFMDIRPVQPGHALVVPKLEVDHFLDVPEPHYSQVFKSAQVVAKALKTATGCNRVGLAVMGYEVPHFHLHLIPSRTMADLDFQKASAMEMDQLKQWQEKILSHLD